MRIQWNSSANGVAAYSTPSKGPTVVKMGPSIPLIDYPSWISIEEQPDGAIYGIVFSTKYDLNRASESPGEGHLISQSYIFRLDDDHGLVKIDPSEGHWPFDQSSEWTSQNIIRKPSPCSLMQSTINSLVQSLPGLCVIIFDACC